jgi:colicin import membrane protein
MTIFLDRFGVKEEEMKSTKLFIAILTLLLSTSALRAQEKMDSTVGNQKTEQSISNVQSPSTDQKPEGKKSKNKKKEKTSDQDSTQQVKEPKAKKGKGSKMDQIVAEKKAEDAAAAIDSLQANGKGSKKGKANPKKPVKAEPVKAEPKIIPGAEAKANAEVKDKEDRTMKGPSGQKVYSSPKGGKYYFDVNGNKKYLRRDNQK